MRKGSLPGAAGNPAIAPPTAMRRGCLLAGADCHFLFYYGWCVSSRLYIRKAHLRYLQVEEIWEVGLYQRVRVP